MHYRLLFILLFTAACLQAQTNCNQLRTLLENGDIETAVEAIREIKTPEAACNIVIGEVYLQKGRNDLAMQFFEKALQQSKKDTEDQAAALNNLGLVFWNTGNYYEAKEYILQALNIRKKIYGNTHEKIAASYNDLGLVSTDEDAALENYEKSLAIYEKLYQSKEHRKIAQSKTNIGIIYRQMEFYGDAQNHFNDALKIWQSLHPEGHPNEGFILTNIGRTYQLLGDMDAAELHYGKALAIYKKHYGQKHPEVASTYNLIGNIYNIRGKFEEAIGEYQRALIANSIYFDDQNIETNPSVNQYFNANTLLNSLYYKAQAFEDLHLSYSLKFKDLKYSLSTLQSADSLIDNLRQISTNEADKLALGEVASQVYENGVRLCHYMAEVSVKKDPYYELSFYFAEKSKAAVLLEAISNASAKSYANIPDEKLAEESELQSEIAYYEQKLAQKPDEETEKRYRQQLFELKQRYSRFVQSLETEYPQYFNLKYNVHIPTVKEIQKGMGEQTSLISYFIADRNQRLYIYQMTKDKFRADNVPQTENFNRYISGLRNSIYFKDDDVYHFTASQLYNILFPATPGKNIKSLVVIPSGRLGTIPFEALLTKSSKSALDYSSNNYLAKGYAVSYQYAAALYIQNKNKPLSEGKSNALLCAPVTFKNLSDLPATNDEVNKLQNIFTGKSIDPEILLEADASEALIRSKDLSLYRYLHFATHGVVNETNPALSRIFLKETSDHDGNLYSGEIYNLKLEADLVTLSACETGLGKISKGEGIIGLSRALLYAGANNVVVSLWNVADASTSDLMTSFYNNLSGANFSQALQKAKLDMINSSSEYSKPYYWAPFVLIGE
ncbi:hypothetical protein C900_01564 [Fulvivirga imtechensis AK7]|uniref:CHAT domain-containing protein n=1 Tax=Fulvivirga imtechensis AK7 TaxID=1237149 RepID=L8JW33_9BACT|nr:CHAT domain-containing tetratricopeptide repeat protein [Fulvivirga imtechensis]ELR72408.1 hypothetical protein C900_01564 [Fulvivirga imtechensis AK7]